MERFIGTDTANFQHIHPGTETFSCRGINFCILCRRSLRLGLEALSHTSPPLYHSENADAYRNFLMCKEIW